MALQFTIWPKMTIDRKAIAHGIYDMTGEMGDNYVCALSLGMLPAPLMAILEKQLIDKVKCECCKIHDCPPTEENKAMWLMPKGKIEEVIKSITLEVLRIASETGLLTV